MSMSKRNPLLRNNNQAFDDVIGNLGEEMKEQQLTNIEGGSAAVCATVTITAVSVCITIRVTRAIF